MHKCMEVALYLHWKIPLDWNYICTNSHQNERNFKNERLANTNRRRKGAQTMYPSTTKESSHSPRKTQNWSKPNMPDDDDATTTKTDHDAQWSTAITSATKWNGALDLCSGRVDLLNWKLLLVELAGGFHRQKERPHLTIHVSHRSALAFLPRVCDCVLFSLPSSRFLRHNFGAFPFDIASLTAAARSARSRLFRLARRADSM